MTPDRQVTLSNGTITDTTENVANGAEPLPACRCRRCSPLAPSGPNTSPISCTRSNHRASPSRPSNSPIPN